MPKPTVQYTPCSDRTNRLLHSEEELNDMATKSQAMVHNDCSTQSQPPRATAGTIPKGIGPFFAVHPEILDTHSLRIFQFSTGTTRLELADSPLTWVSSHHFSAAYCGSSNGCRRAPTGRSLPCRNDGSSVIQCSLGRGIVAAFLSHQVNGK